jgi:putative sigma-54 modulation protein
MNTPLEIAFKGLDKSPAIETKITERAARLEKHFDRMTHCRVVVAAPHKHSHKGKTYEIKIDIGIPGGAPLIVTHESAVGQAQEDLKIALRDAFDAADRRLIELVEKKNGASRAERSRRRPAKVADGDSRTDD